MLKAPTHSKFLLLVACAAAGCGSGAPSARGAADAAQARRLAAEVAALREAGAEQSSALRELEARLALSRAEARDLRDELARRAEPRGAETIVIGRSDQPAEAGRDGWQEPDTELLPVEPGEDEGPRPVLRLYGTPAVSVADLGPLVLPPPPAGVPDRLPVAPMPGEESVASALARDPALYPVPSEPATPSPEEAQALADYRAALELVRGRRFEEAAAALQAFLAAHPRHAWAPNAAYWRGEALYGRRDYAAALDQLQALVRRWPRSGRVPEALLKIGMCHARMGEPRRARAYFRRVREQHPDSVAARLASQEDAS